MVVLLIGVVVFVIIVALFAGKNKPRTGRRRRLTNDPIPELLGIQVEGGGAIVQALDLVLSPSYLDNVKNRVLLEHPNWGDHEFEWTLFELKRYFIMNSLLKSVPMFSASVDDIWHEMLMFTRDYEKFSKDFYRETLHHTPNLDTTPIPGERAFFDWVYLSLFEQTSNSRAIWGGFLQHPIKREILDDFKNLSEDELLHTYFRNNQDWLAIKRSLIQQLKSQINGADQIKRLNGKNTFQTSNSTMDSQLMTYALGACVFYSLYESDHYQEQMNELIPDEFERESHGSGSFCSGFACSSDDHSGGDAGGDSGGSSCSSCGGGCSS